MKFDRPALLIPTAPAPVPGGRAGTVTITNDTSRTWLEVRTASSAGFFKTRSTDRNESKLDPVGPGESVAVGLSFATGTDLQGVRYGGIDITASPVGKHEAVDTARYPLMSAGQGLGVVVGRPGGPEGMGYGNERDSILYAQHPEWIAFVPFGVGMVLMTGLTVNGVPRNDFLNLDQNSPLLSFSTGRIVHSRDRTLLSQAGPCTLSWHEYRQDGTHAGPFTVKV
ncbi:hypothetical protein [Kitasatospora griseola]|uniref:hypothetical protein n=1 Tax=Kitasatospora griseola TaxID=2064 RepID=UPI00342F2576